ncbi:RNA polymerase III transcription factor IIIC subunit-domain-containing protein [Pisolithus croceorrhizus]|nr:RNA polymerase III transcription factor IIIC subunit-domain-containing protein [Pisolithus croceorrhizus]KAI6134876.1 RNA polymerase III transcription factor IIIC subunit-domain-containing protein [Pisolithus croceorrhizus]KAI6162960.1 RNA polymerase III transcription factor IIIC subunit-domain-containing protein [Pisolithus thermaeus]
MVSDTRTAAAAQEQPLPATQFYSVEYPGYVQPSSVHLALRNLGGPSSLENAFKRGAAKNEGLLELNFQPGNPFAHPIPGDIVNTSNILFKVTKRRRRKADGDKTPDAIVGDYTLEAMGVILKAARFRSMADYQFQPDMSDPVAQLRVAMDRMDVDAVGRYTIPDEKEDYSLSLGGSNRAEIDPQLTDQTLSRSNLRLFPPPLFSRQGIPQNYNFKANPASMVAAIADEDTGQERKRLINKGRWKGYGPATISFSDSNVPQNPSAGLLQARSTIKQDLLDRVVNLLEQRPIWTRAALYNQFNSAEVREIHNSKVILPLACYMFQDGPWRDTLVRFSYDPRKDPAARFYQRVYFRNANHPMSRTSVVTRRQEGRSVAAYISRSMEQEETAGIEQRKSHIFDGLTITKETAAFQLCDIVDPMLKEMIEREEDLRETCDERDGWYSAHALERIKTVLRHKFFSLLQGYVATKEECEALLEQSGGQKKTQVTRIGKRLKYGKHNMAKGALRPEDAAAARLQATLERNARNLQTTRRVGKHVCCTLT